MIKFRQAIYCNLKAFLIFLVIYGHLIESQISKSDIIMKQYKWIYLIHMPLFSFLSGLFISKEKDCSLQLKRTLPLYLLLQSIAVLFGNGEVKPLTPWWILWYLLSFSIWLCLTWLWFCCFKQKHKVFILIFAIIVGCLAGFVPWIDRRLSLSRTLVFFPYFFAGVIVKPSFNWKRLRLIGVFSFAAVFAIMIYIGNDIDVTFLYQADPYKSPKGIILRLICYLVGGLLGIFLLSFMPDIRLPFSKIGADTMALYLLHAPVVMWLRERDVAWQLHILFSAAFLFIIHILTKWGGALYGIVSTERRGTGGNLSKHL